LIGSTLRSRTSQEKADILKALQTKLWPHFTSGKLITNIHSVFPMQQADEAHGVLRRCENIGKVVLTLE
jgi:NADPH2:quinone reductase